MNPEVFVAEMRTLYDDIDVIVTYDGPFVSSVTVREDNGRTNTRHFQ